MFFRTMLGDGDFGKRIDHLRLESNFLENLPNIEREEGEARKPDTNSGLENVTNTRVKSLKLYKRELIWQFIISI